MVFLEGMGTGCGTSVSNHQNILLKVTKPSVCATENIFLIDFLWYTTAKESMITRESCKLFTDVCLNTSELISGACLAKMSHILRIVPNIFFLGQQPIDSPH